MGTMQMQSYFVALLLGFIVLLRHSHYGHAFQCHNPSSSSSSSSSSKLFMLDSNNNERQKSIRRGDFFKNLRLEKDDKIQMNEPKMKQDSPSPINRRRAFSQINGVALTIMTTLFASSPDISEAACLSGDTDKQCIGIYKLPVINKNDVDAMEFVGTEEKLRAYAPDINWVPPIERPKSMVEAANELRQDLYHRVKDLNQSVLKGDLTLAGTDILYIVPRITVAGDVVISELERQSSFSSSSDDRESTMMTTPVGYDRSIIGNSNLSMRAYRSEVAYQDLLANLGQCDIMIGQALRGQTRITLSQIEILEVLEEANQNFDDFIKAMSCIDCENKKS